MENPIRKFEKENEVLRMKYLLAKKANCIKIWKRLIILAIVMGVLILISFFFEYIEKLPLSTTRTIALSLVVVWFVSMLASFVISPPSLRSMYADLNSKARDFVKNEVLPEIKSSLLKQNFIPNEDFEKNFLSLIEQINCISGGDLIYSINIYGNYLLIKRGSITYRIFCWAYFDGLFPDPSSLSKTELVIRDDGFVFLVSVLSIEESGEFTLTNK